MVTALSRLPGYADDVARWLVTKAKQEPGRIASVSYEGEVMVARADSRPAEIALTHEQALIQRRREQASGEVPGPVRMPLAMLNQLRPSRSVA
jgi:hypothetical protein